MADSRCQRRKQSHPKRKNVDLENMPDDPETDNHSAMRSSLSPPHPSRSTEMTGGNKGGQADAYSSKLLSNGKVLDTKEQQQPHGINGILPAPIALPPITHTGEEDKIEEYLQRSDTAVIYPEPVGRVKEETDKNNNTPAVVKSEANINNDIQREEGPISNRYLANVFSNKRKRSKVWNNPNRSSVIVEKRKSASECDYHVKCPQCERVFSGNDAIRDLQDHLANAHDTPPTTSKLPEPVKFQPCNKCSATFADKDSLSKHKLYHTASEQGSTGNNTDDTSALRKFKCPECGKAFKFKHHLKEHIRIHSGEKPFACQNCGKRFSHSGSYSSHTTSKKCLVVNLKVRKVDSRSPRGRGSTQNNSFRPIIPKYSAHTTAAATAVGSSELSLVPAGYMPSSERFPSFLSSNRPPQSYMPLTFHPLMTSTPPYLPIGNFPEVTQLLQHRLENEAVTIAEEKPQSHTQMPPLNSADKHEERLDVSHSSHRGLNAVKKILEIVDATVKQQNQQGQQPTEKTRNGLLSELLSAGPQTISKSLPGGDLQPYETRCRFCGHLFDNKVDLHQHERYLCSLNSELHNPKTADNLPENNSDGESSKESSEGGHSKSSSTAVFNGDNLVTLRAHYQMNPRPKKSELIRISRDMKCSTRVVQAWFHSQQHDSKDRINGDSPGSPPALHQMSPFNSVIPHYNGALPTSTASLVSFRSPPPLELSKSIHSNCNNHECDNDQPLDLSVKPKRDDSPVFLSTAIESEALNLSQKSSRTGVSPPKETVFQSSRLQQNQIHDYQIRDASPQPNLQSSLLYKYMQMGVSTSMRSPKHESSSFNPPLAAVTPASPERSPSHAEGPHILPSPDAASCAENCSSPSGTGGSYGHAEENNEGDSFSPSGAKKMRMWHQGEIDDSTLDDSLGQEEDSSGVSGKARKSWKLHKVESEEGMYACDQCDKMFSKQSSLARHKYEHSGQRPHKCDECNKAFKHKHHLTEHKRLHSGEKPFQCKKCLKRFSHSGSYSQHMNHRYSYCKPYHE